MMDPVTLAAAAVGYLVPYLPVLAEGAAKKIGENVPESAGKLVSWLRGKLSAGGQEALDDLAKQPGDDFTREALKRKIAEAVQADPRLAEELRALLPADARPLIAQNQTVSGAGAKAAQVAGNHNTTSVS